VQYGARNRTVYSPKKGPEHRKHDIIDEQTIGRATQELNKNNTYMNNADSIKTWIQSWWTGSVSIVDPSQVPSFWFFVYKLFSSWIWLKYCLLDLKQSINQSIRTHYCIQLYVRTVIINILHFFKPINCIYMYHMKTGVFQTD
jgi:hypothetical protein